MHRAIFAPSSSAFLVGPLCLIAAAAAACVPHRDLPPDQIEKLTKLSDVMDVQATIADPQLKKRDQDSFSDEDWAAFADVGTRLGATSTKVHQFTKGPDFDALADRLHEHAGELAKAAAAKDVKGAQAALGSIKATCKECHSKFK